MELTSNLRKEYEKLFHNMVPKPHHMIPRIVDRLMGNKSRYELVEKETQVPWFLIACIHYMEGNGDFKKQLYNGEPWNRKTRLVPKGLGPWVTWHQSAVQAMFLLKKQVKDELGEDFEWDIPTICYSFENHNGWGYRKYHPSTKSPYLWSYSNIYTRGKYVADGKWNSIAVSKQIGAMVIIKAISRRQGYLYTPLPKPVEEPKPIPTPVEIPKPKPQPKSKDFWNKMCDWWKDKF